VSCFGRGIRSGLLRTAVSRVHLFPASMRHASARTVSLPDQLEPTVRAIATLQVYDAASRRRGERCHP
jgi:hypothetical protein